MKGKCIKHGNGLNLTDFEAVAKPLVLWLQNHGCPHDTIIVKYDGAEFVCGEMAFSVEVPD